LARKELFESNRFFGWFISSLHAIPLERRTFDSTGLRKAIEILQEGGLLVVFPEGTRSKDGKIGKIQKGISLLGLKANVPLVPTLVNGTYQAWPRQYKLPKRLNPVTIKFNKPVWLDKTNISTLTNNWEKLKSDHVK
jgi:1-acyl-sn-glycerol-3-phosphate acyltransferase